MDERDVVRDLVAKLMEAVEASLDGSPAVREAMDELVRNGYVPRLILLADASARAGDTDEDTDAPNDAAEPDYADNGADAGDAPEDESEEARDLRYELTKLDRDFLRTVRIQPESG
jgi:hypothetical protein